MCYQLQNLEIFIRNEFVKQIKERVHCSMENPGAYRERGGGGGGGGWMYDNDNDYWWWENNRKDTPLNVIMIKVAINDQEAP